MSSTIISKVKAMKLKNGKIVPFVLSAASSVRTYSGSYDWRWDNFYVGSCNNFMFDSVEDLQPKVENWAESGSVRYRNGGFITVEGLNKLLTKAFAHPSYFERDLVTVEYTKLSKDRKKATNVTFFPKTEEELLAYMEKHKDDYCHIKFRTREDY